MTILKLVLITCGALLLFYFTFTAGIIIGNGIACEIVICR